MERARLHPRQPIIPKRNLVDRVEPPNEARDAARWRALYNCAGLRVMTEIVQPHDPYRKEESYRYIMVVFATHGNGGRMSKPALLEFVDYLCKHKENQA